ncbi:DedA family protein [Shewanella submarina]|uniref:DedA family protein n=1 Tax=Shewanella submarina TaxID=2016376 RepID=A0ABV7GI30_9GAMM|nr:DedA family protein [Shewanella submarina]MCL1035597.1 DedA family protein [Shewanella submarina]
MLDSIYTVLSALWNQDFNALLAPGSATLIYLCVGTLIFLESGFIPAAPFPCDSVVVLSGTLAAVGVIDPVLILVLLIVCAAMGSWMAYLQGRWLNRLPIVQRWVDSVPSEKLQLVDKLLGRHGLVALFCARFVPVVRSLLPLMMGMRVKEAPKFHYFSWLSAVLWTILLVGLGYLLPSLPEPISKTVTMGLMAAPVITFCVAVTSWIAIKLRSRFKRA